MIPTLDATVWAVISYLLGSIVTYFIVRRPNWPRTKNTRWDDDPDKVELYTQTKISQALENERRRLAGVMILAKEQSEDFEWANSMLREALPMISWVDRDIRNNDGIMRNEATLWLEKAAKGPPSGRK